MDRHVDNRPLRPALSRLRRTALLLALFPALAGATIELPDHVIYGSATVFGNPAAIGSLIEVRRPDGEVLASYAMGRNPRLGGQFSLNIPMDAVEPRVDGRARPGDPIQIWLGSQLAGQTSVGAEGIAVRLDIDPQFLGTGPAVSVADAMVVEGNSGQTLLQFPVSLNTTSNVAVNLDWTTVDGSAVGGMACAADIDYVTDAGTAAVAAGGQSTHIAVLVCGDALIEPDETFTLSLSNAQNAVLATTGVTGTIADDDNVPVLSVANGRALEPGTGSTPMQFRATLSRTSTQVVQVNYSTQDARAVAGADYLAGSGTLSIPVGELEASIGIDILADAEVEADEQFRLLLDSPVHASLAATSTVGVIIDPAYDPAVDPRDGPDNESVPELVAPSALAVSADGRHVYAASDAGDALLLFQRLEASGELAFVTHYDTATAGFAGARLDGPDDLLLSPDGAHLYVASRESDAIAVLARDDASGVLTLLGHVDAGTGASGLDGVVALAMSADGAHVYATGRNANSVVALARNPGTGGLTHLATALDDAFTGGTVDALEQPTSVLVSPDGAHVYVASRASSAVQVFSRETDTTSANYGRLTLAGVRRNGIDGISQLVGPTALAMSSDGAHLYVAAQGSDSVVLFDRAGDGSIIQRQTWTSGPQVPGLQSPSALALTPGGEELHVAGFGDSSLTIFARAGDGSLDERQTVFDGQGAVTTLGGPSSVAVSPDGRNVYVAASTDNAIVVFLRQAFTGIFEDGFGD